MKKEDLLDAMNDIDSELLSDAEGKGMKFSRSKILRLGAIAALLCLALVLIMLPMILQSTDMPLHMGVMAAHGADEQSDGPYVKRIRGRNHTACLLFHVDVLLLSVEQSWINDGFMPNS